METIWVTGANGQLGSELRALADHYPNHQFKFTDHAQVDITDHTAVSTYLETENITVLVNCAAYTAVDKAETEAARANEINHLAVAHMAKEAKRLGVKMIHVSTDYVFDGTSAQPYTEDHLPNPQSVYGRTKLAGEQAIMAINPQNSIILRTSWVFSSYGTNFVKTMLRLANERDEINVVNDQIGSPTYAADLALVILGLISKMDHAHVEVLHYANTGSCSWYEFAIAIFKEVKVTVTVNPVPSSAYKTMANRPLCSLLNTRKIQKMNSVSIRSWQEALKDCLRGMK